MFSEVSEECVKQAIHAETEDAVVKWGKTYSSLHEGYAVLKEEVEETNAEKEGLTECLELFWKNVVKAPEYHRNEKITQVHIEHIKEHALSLALEAVQVAAVCNKILNGL